jgi:hypothetical protein
LNPRVVMHRNRRIDAQMRLDDSGIVVEPNVEWKRWYTWPMLTLAFASGSFGKGKI